MTQPSARIVEVQPSPFARRRLAGGFDAERARRACAVWVAESERLREGAADERARPAREDLLAFGDAAFEVLRALLPEVSVEALSEAAVGLALLFAAGRTADRADAGLARVVPLSRGGTAAPDARARGGAGRAAGEGAAR